MSSHISLGDLLANLTDYESPFDIQGTDDPAQNQEQHPIVDVGLVHNAGEKLSQCLSLNGASVMHGLLIAPYGGGKSATLRQIRTRALTAEKPFAYKKLEQGKFKQAIRKPKDTAIAFTTILFDELGREVVKRVVKLQGNTGKKHGPAWKKAWTSLAKEAEGRPLGNVFTLLAEFVRNSGHEPGVVLIDELEAVLADSEVPENVKVDILDNLKNWSESTKRGLCIVLAGTQACLDFIRLKSPKILGGRYQVFDAYALDVDEVADYIIKKVEVATNNNQNSRDIFSEEAIQLVHIASGGIPRRVEMICYDAWNSAVVSGSQIGREAIRQILYNKGFGTLTPLMDDLRLTPLQRRSLRKLLRGGMSTITARKNLSAKELGAIRRLAHKDLQTPIVVHRSRGWYEFSDAMLILMFSANQG
jgi:hypothetical protein